MYLLGLGFACFSNSQMRRVFKWWVGPPAAAGPSSLENNVFLREGKKPSIRSGQCRALRCQRLCLESGTLVSGKIWASLSERMKTQRLW